MNKNVQTALNLLDLHYESFYTAAALASETGHPVPTDTRGWSQVLVSTLCGVKGLDRKKGPDLKDGSDVKAAITWEAIDTPRFNGVIKAGTQARTSGQLSSLDKMPRLFLVLWDQTAQGVGRCRIWVVRPQHDSEFRAICADWYAKREAGEIKSNNFQLHPPRGKHTNEIRNTCGNLVYPLYFHAERTTNKKYTVKRYNPRALTKDTCTKIGNKAG